MVLYFVGIWAIAIFGFQILLKVVEKPTPEPEYIAFSEVLESVNSGHASKADLKIYGQTILQVLSKVFVDDNSKQALNKELNATLYTIADEGQKVILTNNIKEFQELKSTITDITDPVYIDRKLALGLIAGDILGLQANDIRLTILPLELDAELLTEPKPAAGIPLVMAKYMIHNRSFLTDFRFLGFPFHYFYTAVFLLVLFVFLCWLYCVKIDKLDDMLGIVE